MQAKVLKIRILSVIIYFNDYSALPGVVGHPAEKAGNMTLVEFFDSDSIENVCAGLSLNPERIIFLGYSSEPMEKAVGRYRDIFAERKMHPEFICRKVGRNNLNSIVSMLTGIVEKCSEENDGCVIDLTGGEDLYLVAAGMAAEKMSGKDLRLHRCNIRTNSAAFFPRDEEHPEKTFSAGVSVSENVKIYGGVIVSSGGPGPGEKWDMSPRFRREIRKIWDVCRADAGEWNAAAGFFAFAFSRFSESDALSFTADSEVLAREASAAGLSFSSGERIAEKLSGCGIVTGYKNADGEFFLEFSGRQVKKVCTVSGLALEMIIYRAALEAEENGKPYYDDVLNGVKLDWDGVVHDGSENEVDVVMMRGMTPVFVSCKNGYISSDELYMIDSVSYKFGGKYAKKILVATSLSDNTLIRKRAEEMGIRLVEGAGKKNGSVDLCDLDFHGMKELVKSFF